MKLTNIWLPGGETSRQKQPAANHSPPAACEDAVEETTAANTTGTLWEQAHPDWREVDSVRSKPHTGTSPNVAIFPKRGHKWANLLKSLLCEHAGRPEPLFTGPWSHLLVIFGTPRGDKRTVPTVRRSSGSRNITSTCPLLLPRPQRPRRKEAHSTHPVHRRRLAAAQRPAPASPRPPAALGVGAGNSRCRRRRWSHRWRPQRLSPRRACSLSARRDGR